jgi:hypothetical protein
MVVTPPATVSGVVGEFNITLCFREANSASANSPDYCPLGLTTVPANTTFPAHTLELGDGGNQLPGPYPAGISTISAGVGVFLRVDRVEMNGSTGWAANSTVLQAQADPGTVTGVSMLPINGGGFYSVQYLVDCVAGFTGVDCNQLESIPIAFLDTMIGKGNSIAYQLVFQVCSLDLWYRFGSRIWGQIDGSHPFKKTAPTLC